MITTIGTALAILMTILKWIGDHYSEKAKEYEQFKRDISNAVDSGDNARLNAIIDKLRS